MKNVLLLLVVMILFPSSLSALNLKGNVLDDRGNPLEFVNVVLLRDSSFIDGVVTNSQGEFTLLTNSLLGYKLRFSLIGYKTILMDSIKSEEVGNVVMQTDTKELDEIVIKGNSSNTYLRGNALVTNVENSILANAGNAKDVLRLIPMVIENNGNIEVFGKGIPIIYINGRKITDSQELSTLLSGNIHTVEVISNPGISYSADAKAVIRIRTKKPQGDGLSGSFKFSNGFQHYFQSDNVADIKYRQASYELFANLYYNVGKSWENKFSDMTTNANSVWKQTMSTINSKHYRAILGKLGFAWIINNRNSIGTYYQNAYARNENRSDLKSNVKENGDFYDNWETLADIVAKNTPRHAVNVYYNGQIKKLNIDFNVDYIWNRENQDAINNETSVERSNQTVTTYSLSKGRMLAEKLVLTYPIGKGNIMFGEEHTSSRTCNSFNTVYAGLVDSNSEIKEDNTAVFVESSQLFGNFSISAGIRYEHVNYNYFEHENTEYNLSKVYNNIFPSFNISTRLGEAQMSLSFSSRVERPTYANMNANVSYLNRMTYETGNPRLQPTKTYNLEYMIVWKDFFAQASYSYFDDPIVSTTQPYNADGDITILTYENFKKKHFLQIFMGGQFKIGVWQPRINLGMFAQRFNISVADKGKNMNKPIGILQWQNALHLPFDFWLNIDCQWTTSGNDRNIYAGSSSYVNAKLYKDLCKKRLSFTLEVRDIFNESRQHFTLYNNNVTMFQKNYSDLRNIMFTLQYNFNITNSRYRGTGAGNSEKKRL